MAPKKKRTPPRSRDELRPVDKAFIHSVMFQMGILPIEDPTLDMRVPLRQLSPDESRTVKRKFRKLWRKYMRDEIGSPTAKNAEIKKKSAERKFGLKKAIPSRQERLARKRLVYERIWEELIVPMLINFENPERKLDEPDVSQATETLVQVVPNA